MTVVDTPAVIAILGAGPIGLEAALYARFLGYEVNLYERGQIAENVLSWGHVRMFSPFRKNCSSLALAALIAQDPTYQAPDDADILTGREWVERYIAPLAETDLLADSLLLGATVLSVGRENMLKSDMPGTKQRAESPFRILYRNSAGQEQTAPADVLIDASGVYGNPNWMGPGGTPAIGEIECRSHIEYGSPDILGSQREKYAAGRTLLVGGGYSAATTGVALTQLAAEHPDSHTIWITRGGSIGEGPIPRIANDKLLERDQLAVAANHSACNSEKHLEYYAETILQSVAYDQQKNVFTVELSGLLNGCFEFENIVANVGYRPDNQIYQELQVHECYASGGPIKLAAALQDNASADYLDQPECGPERLLCPEPNFYFLGSKSYGRDSRFLFSNGLVQIRQLFSMIGGRADLDLYAGAKKITQ